MDNKVILKAVSFMGLGLTNIYDAPFESFLDAFEAVQKLKQEVSFPNLWFIVDSRGSYSGEILIDGHYHPAPQWLYEIAVRSIFVEEKSGS